MSTLYTDHSVNARSGSRFHLQNDAKLARKLRSAEHATTEFDAAMQQKRVEPEPTRPLVIVHPSRLFRMCLKKALIGALGHDVRDYPVFEGVMDENRAGEFALLLIGFGAGVAMPAIDQILEQAGHSVPVVFTGECEDPKIVAELLSKGVSGFIPNSLDLDVMIPALALILAGGSYVPADYLLKLSRAPAAAKEQVGAPGELTAKQLVVIEAIRKGKPNKTIAYELNMCESTVKVHVRNIMKKLQARNRTQVAYIANRLLSGEPTIAS
jgi:DNA-binding NarL/FixJ family response regulator